MLIKFKRVWKKDIEEYKDILNKYDVKQMENGVASIEINDVEDLFKLAKEVDHDLIVSGFHGDTIEIYDDYIE